MTSNADPSSYLSSLAPSFLKHDTQGRVIRLETFSKTLAPGNRLGYFICNSMFSERLLRATEVETQSPSGWSTVILSNLLHAWGISGYATWLSGLRTQYRTRRDWLCDAIASNFSVSPAQLQPDLDAAEGSLVACSRSEADRRPLFSFVPPTAGMFVWARFYFSSFPRFCGLRDSKSCADPERQFQDELWLAMAEALVLLTPGSYYTPWQGEDRVTTKARGAKGGQGYFRLAFSMTTKEEMERGVERLAGVLEKALKGTKEI